MADTGLNKGQREGMRALRSGRNVCLTGEPGTGKTYLLNEYIKEQEAAGKIIIKTAPTGIAALKINGVTMHNAYGIPVPAYGKYDFDITPAKAKPLMSADIIIIEEISMCRSDVFEYFELVFKKAQEMKKAEGITKKTQVIVCGDFFQLPPIVKKEEINAFRRLALDVSGYCFTSPSWKNFKFKMVTLKDIVRQNDAVFIENLADLRRGGTKCLDYFNKRVTENPPDDVMHICSTNAEADEINNRHLDAIDEPCSVYRAVKTGYTGKDYSVDEFLMLKPGAKVMFMANDTEHDNYRNGQMGVVKTCLKEKVIVETDGKEIWVEPYRWPTNKITVVNGMANKKEIGAYMQLPIKPAYAITMHKTQGQTYESAVISPNSFADGQLYVAISRVTSTEGLYFTSEILPEYVKASPLVLAFDSGDYEIPETRVKKKKELAAKAKKKHNEKKKPKKTSTTKKTTSSKKTTPAKKTSTTKKTMANRTKAKKTTSSKKTTSAKKTTANAKTSNKRKK